MSQEGQARAETRAEEVARVRSYLTAQAAKRTPAQMVEVLKEAHQQFVQATRAVPESLFHTPAQPGEWSAAQVLTHMVEMADFDVQTIVTLLETGQKGSDWSSFARQSSQIETREDGLSKLNALRETLMAAAVAATPEAQVEVVAWVHPEFGELRWREALLFARVHTLDHARQMAAIAEHFARATANKAETKEGASSL
jgi:hypothetical protein